MQDAQTWPFMDWMYAGVLNWTTKEKIHRRCYDNKEMSGDIFHHEKGEMYNLCIEQ